MQHVVKHNKQKGHTFLPFILLYTGADALNLNELHPIQSRVKELICNLKNFRYVSFMPNRTGRELHQGNSEARDGGGGQGPLAHLPQSCSGRDAQSSGRFGSSPWRRLRRLWAACAPSPTQKRYLMSRGSLLRFAWCPLPLLLALGATEESLAPPSPQVFMGIDEIALRLFSGLSRPSSLSPSSRKCAPAPT